VTFDELNELLPSTTTTPEYIEALMQALSDEGINVIEDEGP
jgi:RNA polymerase primary sigma factor